MTKTLKAYFDYMNEFREIREKYEKVIREEFPAGTKVKWKRGGKVQYGIVQPHGYSMDRLDVRNGKTGNTIQIEAKELELQQ